MNKIEINLQSQNNYPSIGNKKIGVTLLRKMITSVLTSLSVKNKTVSFMFCNNQIIKVLNSEYRKKDYPTDVLSFLSETDNYLGDIAISLDKTHEQANEHEISFEDELYKLIIHGVLHLLGYDHERSETDEKVMLDLEEKVFLEVKNISLC